MNKKQTVSVGISAYNEEANIGRLLRSILSQTEKNYLLKEIIVVADGCTDNTITEVKAISDKRIILIDDHKRKGKSARLNEIIYTCRGDILVLMDADIAIKDKNFLNSFISSVDFRKAGLAAPNYLPLPAKNFFEGCLHASLAVQMDLRKKWNKGKNYLAFKGACMALDHTFAQSIFLPEKLINNDGYIYFKAIGKGYHPRYVPETAVYYKTPSNFRDHLAQTSRFQASENELEKYIQIPAAEYHIPKLLYYRTSLKYLLKEPVYMISYMGIRLLSKFLKKKQLRTKWVIASSTKTLGKNT